MNLLVFNIRTDADHPTQGVTTGWLNALGERFEHISVITMHKGRLALRKNIEVYSVGGERGVSRAMKVLNFYRLLRQTLKKRHFDGCFTHMAVLFTLLGGPILALKGIPRITWYAHSVINPVMFGAFMLSDAVVTASPDSFRIKAGKVKVTGHGIDTALYSRRPRAPNEVFVIGSVGRISRIKGYETLIKAVHLMIMEGCRDFKVMLYGNVQTEDDRKYRQELDDLCKTYGLQSFVRFPGPLKREEVPAIVSGFDVFVNMLSRGGAGKAVLEAMSIEVPTLVCTPAFNQVLSPEDRLRLVFRAGDPGDLKEKIVGIMQMDSYRRKFMIFSPVLTGAEVVRG
ncbi:MAG: glycosyltransferase family 4 protein [Deltaproteobacteria bacterium]|nr:glycosyltransferase family 4 protein [Deltaproteobacteria bacterium]